MLEARAPSRDGSTTMIWQYILRLFDRHEHTGNESIVRDLNLVAEKFGTVAYRLDKQYNPQRDMLIRETMIIASKARSRIALLPDVSVFATFVIEDEKRFWRYTVVSPQIPGELRTVKRREAVRFAEKLMRDLHKLDQLQKDRTDE